MQIPKTSLNWNQKLSVETSVNLSEKWLVISAKSLAYKVKERKLYARPVIQ